MHAVSIGGIFLGRESDSGKFNRLQNSEEGW